jgi:hypothetical protein
LGVGRNNVGQLVNHNDESIVGIINKSLLHKEKIKTISCGLYHNLILTGQKMLTILQNLFFF